MSLEDLIKRKKKMTVDIRPFIKKYTYIISILSILLASLSFGLVYYKIFEEPTHVCIEEEGVLDFEHCIGNLSPTERTCYRKWDYRSRDFCKTGWIRYG